MLWVVFMPFWNSGFHIWYMYMSIKNLNLNLWRDPWLPSCVWSLQGVEIKPVGHLVSVMESGVGVTQPIFAVHYFLYSFKIMMTALVTGWIAHSYLAGVTTAKLWWHLSNMNVIQSISDVCQQNENRPWWGNYWKMEVTPTPGLMHPSCVGLDRFTDRFIDRFIASGSSLGSI